MIHGPCQVSLYWRLFKLKHSQVLKKTQLGGTFSILLSFKS